MSDDVYCFTCGRTDAEHKQEDYIEGVLGDRHCIADAPISTRCDGCDDLQSDVATYRARFAGDSAWETVQYCGGCADLARMNWNGETDAIEPILEA